ncbi:flagellar hook-basal body complex protein [Planctomycetota bacterium]
MSSALSAGVSGVQAHQKMLNIAGNNLANINTVGYKSSRIVFSELLSETIKKASQPTATLGGTNPQQMGSGVGIASISADMAQGNISNTGNPLDLALEGAGYFVLSDGSQNVYTRAGMFAVDANSNLVDPSTGYIVQRIGSVGEIDGFQAVGDSNIKIPYDVAISANATTSVSVVGNLSANGLLETAQINVMSSNKAFTTGSGASNATTATLISDLDQYSGTLSAGVLTFSGFKPDGTALGATPTVDLTMPITSTTTVGDVLTWLNTTEGTAAVEEVQTVTLSAAPASGTFTLTYGGETTAAIDWDATDVEIETALELLSTVSSGDIDVSAAMANGVTFTFADTLGDVGLLTADTTLLLDITPVAITNSIAETTPGFELQGILGDGATATFLNGKIVITDAASGYSQTDLAMSYTGDGTLTLSGYFEATTVGGTEVKNANITVYDSLGGAHVLSASFVRTASNTWDMVLASITGDIDSITFDNRRISGIEFNGTSGTYAGLSSPTESAQFGVTFANDTTTPQIMSIGLGTIGKLNGLTQFSNTSTAVLNEQDGYESGRLSSVSISNTGSLIGSFSNGIKKNLATIQLATFKNPSGLESNGGGYFIPSINSGGAVATQATVGSAGTIHSGAVEQSNADVAKLFVEMIEAQNGYHANARTIKVANDMLQELTNIIR